MAFIPWLLTPGSMPQGGAWGQKPTPLTSVFLLFCYGISLSRYWSDMAQPCDMDLWVMKWRSAWPIFHGQVILSYILKTIWCMYIILWEYESVWPDVWSLWPIFHGPVILPYILKTIWYMNNMSRYDPKFDLKINIGHCDLYFMVQWFCLISWLFDVCTSYFGSMNQYDQTFDLKINVCHCELYCMVQWFCLISWRLFDAWTLLFGIMRQYDPNFYLKINIGHCDLYFMVQWFSFTSWRLFNVWTSYFGVKGQYDLTFDLKIDVGLCDLYFMV